MKSTHFLSLNKKNKNYLKLYFVLVFTLFSFISQAQNIYIPDANFKAALIAEGVDTNGDGQISISEAHAVTGELNVAGESINSIVGIRYFINLTSFLANNNNISGLDISNLESLETLVLNNNSITNIDVYDLENLKDFRIYGNDLTSIDLSNNTLLENLSIRDNNLDELNLTQNTELIYLYAQNNNIDEILLNINADLVYVNLDNNSLSTLSILLNHPNLTELHCAGNMINSLNLSGLSNLTKLYCNNNQLTNDAINLNTTDLEILFANDNLLDGTLDFSELFDLTELDLSNNPSVESIDLRNGHNTDITFFNATGNTALESICVDDATWSTTATGWSVDDISLYSTCLIAIPDSNFEQALIDAGIDTNYDPLGSPLIPNGYINTSDVIDVSSLNLSDLDIHDFTGIEYFTDLISLFIQDNNITSGNVDLSNISGLTKLSANNCNLNTNITLPISGSIERLYLDDNPSLNTFQFNSLISNQTNLIYLSFQNNNVDYIDVTNAPNLKQLYCSNSPNLEELDLSNATQLEVLEAANCHFDVIDFSACTALTDIDVSNNIINTLTFGMASNIDVLRCNNNNLTSLDVSAMPSLDFLRCNVNSLTTLDVSNNANLGSLYCSDNPIETLNIQNGNNDILIYMSANNLAAGSCIQVDDASNTPPADTGTTIYHWIIDATASISEDCSAFTYIPDDNFEQAIIDLGLDTVLDDYVLTSNISNLALIDLSSKNISDFTGINDFEALEQLFCANNEMASLDVSNLSNLIKLSAYSNPNLATLVLENDNNIDLISIDECDFDDVSDIINASPSLISLYIPGNNLTGNLDFSNLPNLKTLIASNNELENIDITQNYQLVVLYVDNNNLEVLELNHLTDLTQLWVNDNSLRTLEVKNGHNTYFSEFKADNNPLLTCIEVDDAAWSTANWTDIDAVSSFDEDCSGGVTYVPDDAFENWLIANGHDTTMDNYVITADINTLTHVIMPGEGISDLTGIEDFTALEVLVVNNNNLTSLNFYNNASLRIVDANTNSLTNINIADNTALEVLRLNDNELTTIDVSNNTNLITFTCASNLLTNLDLSLNTSLEEVVVPNNQLTNFNIQNTNNTIITQFITVDNPDLSCITVDDAAYSTANWTNIDATTGFGEHCYQTYVPDNNFEQALIDLGYDDVLDDYVVTDNINTVMLLLLYSKNIDDLTGIEDFEGLSSLSVNSNNLSSLDLSENINLRHLDCANNVLTSLTLPAGNLLEDVDCKNNQLTNLDFSGKTNLMSIQCKNNLLTTIDITGCTSLEDLECRNNVTLTSLNVSTNVNLTYLNFSETSINSISLSNNTNLEAIDCAGASLTNLDVALNPNLIELFCEDNALTELNLSQNSNLRVIACSANSLTSLDLSNNPALEDIECSYNNLSSLNIKNGVNAIIIDDFNAENNPDLYCIEVENPTYFNANFSDEIDLQTSFNLSCSVTLDVSVIGNGSVNLSPTGGSYYIGEEVTLTAIPDAGWEFVGWSGDLSGATNPENITMDTDKMVTANFVQIQYTLTTTTVGNGSVSPAGGTYYDGTVINLTAIPDTGWEFTGWSGDLSGTTNPETITMNANKNVTATFTEIVIPQYTLTINTTGNGSVALSPIESTYDEGTIVTLFATPDTGWVFAGWSGDLSGTTNPETITMNANKNVTAIFTNDTSVNNEEFISSKIVIYPNPTESFINIGLDNNLIIQKIVVSNIEGKKLLEKMDTNKISLQNFESGIYFIKIETDKGTVVKRVIRK